MSESEPLFFYQSISSISRSRYSRSCLRSELIRKRAGIEPGADGMYGLKKNMTQKQMRQAIQEERRLEFAFEGHRFFDVRRWMIAPQTESKTMHGIEITRATD